MAKIPKINIFFFGYLHHHQSKIKTILLMFQQKFSSVCVFTFFVKEIIACVIKIFCCCCSMPYKIAYKILSKLCLIHLHFKMVQIRLFQSYGHYIIKNQLIYAFCKLMFRCNITKIEIFFYKIFPMIEATKSHFKVNYKNSKACSYVISLGRAVCCMFN